MLKTNVVLCLLATMLISLGGCGQANQLYSSVTGSAGETCIDGVMYLQFVSGATVKYKTDGKIALCKS